MIFVRKLVLETLQEMGFLVREEPLEIAARRRPFHLIIKLTNDGKISKITAHRDISQFFRSHLSIKDDMSEKIRKRFLFLYHKKLESTL